MAFTHWNELLWYGPRAFDHSFQHKKPTTAFATAGSHVTDKTGPLVPRAIIHKWECVACLHQTVHLARCLGSPNLSCSLRALSSAAPTLASVPPESARAGPPRDVLSL